MGGAGLAEFEANFLDNQVQLLDQPLVHRIRMVTGEYGDPLNEVELPRHFLKNHGGTLMGNNVIKWFPDWTVRKLNLGETIRITGSESPRLASAFFAEINVGFRWSSQVLSLAIVESSHGRGPTIFSGVNNVKCVVVWRGDIGGGQYGPPPDL